MKSTIWNSPQECRICFQGMAGHSMQVKERHCEKVGADFEQVHESIKEKHPAFVDGW